MDGVGVQPAVLEKGRCGRPQFVLRKAKLDEIESWLVRHLCVRTRACVCASVRTRACVCACVRVHVCAGMPFPATLAARLSLP